ncbi:hypothetical protein BOX37_08360 [Nocardia mangyaensis]|uniref:UvrD-like helicase ATP-binding domain-containing protein n=1 Tax=Nocardia mangyaensis TaxID=2213200 RepID=A0A1J0VPS8_9NOCA|nr:UvrD-helicase domain-containing protein [Nocardia mangyaensis]APE33983.1 hypothetical protein BOX37_08360 [Nocardia mangyaensis]
MTSRVAAPDTAADIALREVLDRCERRGFVVVAGAGSGKTTSLVKALDHVAVSRGPRLRARTQQVACITYTSVAAEEIAADVGHNPLVSVSTIHSFLWSLIRPFQRDIRAYVIRKLEAKAEEIASKQDSYPKGTQRRTIEKDAGDLQRLRRQIEAAVSVEKFQYGYGIDYGTGSLGHGDVMKIGTELIIGKPLLAQIAAQQYPYIFVDESQDTFAEVVKALKHIYTQDVGGICLGFFGDPMQQIYQRGVGAIELEPGWDRIQKPENFRSSRRVLQIVNQVRSKADGLIQVPGRKPSEQREGECFVFVLPADERRTESLNQARRWLSQHSTNGAWTPGTDIEDDGAKILIIMHRMAAARLGFLQLFSAFHDYRDNALKDAFDDGTAWPLRPFDELILPLCAPENEGSPAMVSVLRDHIDRELAVPGADPRTVLATTRAAVSQIKSTMMAGGADSVGKVLRLAAKYGLYNPDPRFSIILDPDSVDDDDAPASPVQATLKAFAACDTRQLENYYSYIHQQSPYSTQHGTKGSEFSKVLVILDDEEASRFTLYSYEKLFGIKDLSARDLEHQASGKDSVLERTRRLLYVCVSRAVESLAIVIFAHDIEAAKAAVETDLLIDGKALTLANISLGG